MVIDDFVMLGRTVPEQSKKHGLVACSAGYSEEMKRFMRVYPLAPTERIPKWTQCRLSLRRNPSDSRDESWRLDDDKSDVVSIIGKKSKDEQFDFLKSMASDSIAKLNADKKSLGIIVPSITGWHFSGLSDNEERQFPLFEGQEDMKKMVPRIRFDDNSGHHNLQLRDWGCFELLRKGADPEKLWSALKLNDPTYEHIFFVGNHNAHRSSWLIISVISKRKSMNLDLFGE
jgi:hypothetical protein